MSQNNLLESVVELLLFDLVDRQRRVYHGSDLVKQICFLKVYLPFFHCHLFAHRLSDWDLSLKGFGIK